MKPQLTAVLIGIIGGLSEFPIRKMEVDRTGGYLLYWLLLARYVIGSHMLLCAALVFYPRVLWRQVVERFYSIATPMGLAVTVVFYLNRKLHEL